jgi:uncharacterized protein
MSPQPERRTDKVVTPASSPSPLPRPAEYSPEERDFLVRLAHEAINAELEGREAQVGSVAEHLEALRGAFTTLYLDDEVRGCVGFVYAVSPLFQTVLETARAAAFQDTRFLPVSCDEAPHLQIVINVLSPLTTMRPEEIELGTHGLLISLGNARGLLLPQVATEHGWDVPTFLSHTCMKAGLPPDAWQHDAKIEGFTAEIFGERQE